MPDFSKGKIYKITNDYNDDIYIGSTCDSLCKRFSNHKAHSTLEHKKHTLLYKLVNEIGFNRFKIELIEEYPCSDKYTLRQREGYFIREMGTLNQLIAGRTNKEYHKEHQKAYYERVKEHKKEYDKKYYEENKERKKEYDKKRNIENAEKKKEIRSQNFICECGCSMVFGAKHKHLKSKKHLSLMAEKTNLA
jgi:group I intron endonuclease